MYIYICMRVCNYMCVYIHICMHMFMYMYMYVYMYVYKSIRLLLCFCLVVYLSIYLFIISLSVWGVQTRHMHVCAHMYVGLVESFWMCPPCFVGTVGKTAEHETDATF